MPQNHRDITLGRSYLDKAPHHGSTWRFEPTQTIAVMSRHAPYLRVSDMAIRAHFSLSNPEYVLPAPVCAQDMFYDLAGKLCLVRDPSCVQLEVYSVHR